MGRPQQPSEERDRLLSDWMTDTATFSSTTFTAHINPQSLAFTKDGGLAVGFMIPVGQAEQALPLRLLLRDRLPVEVTVTLPETLKNLLATQQLRVVDGTEDH